MAWTQEDQDNLMILQEREEFQSVIKLVKEVIKDKEARVLNFNLDHKSFGRLELEKARFDGATSVYKKLKERLSKKRVAALDAKGIVRWNKKTKQ